MLSSTPTRHFGHQLRMHAQVHLLCSVLVQLWHTVQLQTPGQLRHCQASLFASIYGYTLACAHGCGKESTFLCVLTPSLTTFLEFLTFLRGKHTHTRTHTHTDTHTQCTVVHSHMSQYRHPTNSATTCSGGRWHTPSVYVALVCTSLRL